MVLFSDLLKWDMEDNTRVMLQLATFLAQNNIQNQQESNPGTTQTNLITALAKQVLLNSTSNSMASENAISTSRHNFHSSNTSAESLSKDREQSNTSSANKLYCFQENDRSTFHSNITHREYRNNTNTAEMLPNDLISTFRHHDKFGQHSSEKALTSANQIRAGNPGFNTNSQRVVHAIRMMKKREKGKRGPKEKETFQRFFYCLPDKHSKLPKFSSSELLEKTLVRSHCDQGYGMSVLNSILLCY